MVASLAIHRLSARTPARAEAVAARLALQALGADLEDALPRGLPPQALLWLRRLQLQAPEAALLRPAPAAWRQDWIAAGRERFDAALAQAVRPALGPVPASAPAVLFADAAEMLACLALAAQAGQLDRWWWRGLLGRAWPQWQAAWAARPEAQAGAQRLLARLGQGGAAAPWMAAQPRVQAVAESAPVARSGAVEAEPLPPERAALALPPAVSEARAIHGGGNAAPAGSLDAMGRVAEPGAARELPRAAGSTPAEASPTPAEPSSAAAVAARIAAPPTPLPPRRVGPAPAATPDGAREQPSPKPFAPVDRAEPSARPSEPGLRRRRGTPTSAAPATPPVSGRAVEPASAIATLPSESPPDAGAAAPSRPSQNAAASVGHAAQSSQTSAPQTRSARAIAPEPPPQRSVPTEEAAVLWPWPEAVLTHQAPLLFIVNALLEDGLYPDFTRPRDPGLPVPLWALLAALARAWRLPAGDPLWAALAERSPDWIAPDTMPAAPGAAAGPWPRWLAAYARSLRRRLCRRLGLRVAAWPHALTLARPTRLWLSEAEWVAEFDLSAHDVAWRLAGLDRDPGWLPSAACGLRFVFS